MSETFANARGHASGHDDSVTTALNSGIVYVTSGTGILSVAVSGTDYEPPINTGISSQYWRGDKTWQLVPDTGGGVGVVYAPTGATYIVQVVSATLTNEQALADLNTGILKFTSGTGLVSIASSASDYQVWIPTGTTAQFYRGDKSWATPSGGSESEIIVRLGSDAVSTGTALKSVPDLAWSVSTSTDYLFEFYILYTTSSTASGINLGLTGPVGRTALGAMIIANNAVTALTLAGRQIKDYTTTGLTFTACVTGVNYATMQGILRNGLTAGTCTMLYASEVAAQSTTIYTGSILRYRQTNP